MTCRKEERDHVELLHFERSDRFRDIIKQNPELAAWREERIAQEYNGTITITEACGLSCALIDNDNYRQWLSGRHDTCGTFLRNCVQFLPASQMRTPMRRSLEGASIHSKVQEINTRRLSCLKTALGGP